MMRPITMLIWSQWRQTRWAAIATFGSAVTVGALSAYNNTQHPDDWEIFAQLILTIGTMFTMGILAFMHANKSALRIGYPTHLKLLPMKSITVAIVEIAYALVLVGVLILGTYMTLAQMWGKPLELEDTLGFTPFSLTYWLFAVLLMYALVWAVSMLNAPAALAIPFLCTFLILDFNGHPALVTVLSLCAAGVALAGASYGRAGRLRGVGPRVEWSKLVPSVTIRKPINLLSEMEFRPSAPALAGVYIFSLIPVVLLHWIQLSGESGTLQHAAATSLDALLIYAFLSGALTLTGDVRKLLLGQIDCSMAYPVKTSVLVRAHTLAFFKRIAVPGFIAICLTGIACSYGSNPFRTSTTSRFLAGFFPFIQDDLVFVWQVGAAYCLVLMIVWIAERLNVLLSVYFFVIALILNQSDPDSMPLIMVCGSLTLLALSLLSCLRIKRERAKTLVEVSLLWFVTFIMTFWVGIDHKPSVYRMSESNVILSADPEAVAIAIVFATFVVVPLPLYYTLLYRARHRA